MKTGVKVLSIISLIVGLIWAAVGFFGIWFGGALSATGSALSGDHVGANKTVNDSAMLMIKLIISFIVVIAASVFGIVGSDKQPLRTKTLVMGVLTFICGIALFPLANYIAAVLYIIAGFLLLLAGFKTPASQTDSDI